MVNELDVGTATSPRVRLRLTIARTESTARESVVMGSLPAVGHCVPKGRICVRRRLSLMMYTVIHGALAAPGWVEKAANPPNEPV